jgi:hypothetical protein
MISTPANAPEQHDLHAPRQAEPGTLPDQYSLTELLHAGATAMLYRGVRHRDGQSVIIKVLRVAPSAPRDVERLRHE